MKIYLLRKIRFLTLMALLGFFAYILGYGAARLLKNYAFESNNTIINKQTHSEEQKISKPQNEHQSKNKIKSQLKNRIPAQTPNVSY